MFFVLAYSYDGGKTWEDRLDRTWETGQEAQAECKRLNDYWRSLVDQYRKNGSFGLDHYGKQKCRVRKVLDTDEDNFVAREAAKGHKPLEYKGGQYLEHYMLPHYHPDNPKQVRFFATVWDAIECRYTTINISRFLTTYLGEPYDKVEQFLVEIGYYGDNEREFKILRTAEEIQWAYENGPTSCMADPEEYPLPDPHPATVYASPDLGIAVIKRGDSCSARCLVWPKKKIYGRPYGHTTLLKAELEKLGYRHTMAKSAWLGARLVKIWSKAEREFIMPYIDVTDTVSESKDGEWMRIAADKGKYSCRETSGFTYSEETWY